MRIRRKDGLFAEGRAGIRLEGPMTRRRMRRSAGEVAAMPVGLEALRASDNNATACVVLFAQFKGVESVSSRFRSQSARYLRNKPDEDAGDEGRKHG